MIGDCIVSCVFSHRHRVNADHCHQVAMATSLVLVPWDVLSIDELQLSSAAANSKGRSFATGLSKHPSRCSVVHGIRVRGCSF